MEKGFGGDERLVHQDFGDSDSDWSTSSGFNGEAQTTSDSEYDEYYAKLKS